MNRPAALDRFRTESFDLCIIGGGASGTGAALDAALRGLRVALIERDDFAAGTSSKSTKLVHGGVRYLEQAVKNLDFGQLRQVRHGLAERQRVLANAPHLAQPLGLVTPVFSWLEGLYYTVGLRLYDLLSLGRTTLPRARWLNRGETLQRLPGLNRRLHSAVLYYDGQLDDARYCLALAQTAAEAGAAVANHIEFVEFQKNTDTGQLVGARLRDALTGEEIHLRARTFLNCTGPQADRVRRLANPALELRLRPSKGVHIVLPRETLDGSADALLIPRTPDGRVLFAIPYGDRYLVGTTDQADSDLDQEPLLEADEVDFLLDTLNRYVEKPVSPTGVRAGFGGLRPLIDASSARSTKRLLRDHEVEHDEGSGLFSLLGGKWTTYRLMAADAIDAVCRTLHHQMPSRTADHRLAGGEHFSADGWRPLVAQSGLEPSIAQHLYRSYGSRASILADLLRSDADLGRRLHPDFLYLRAEVVYAVRHGMACTVRDVLARRLRIELLDWPAAAAASTETARLLGAELGWDAATIAQHTDDYRRQVQRWLQNASETVKI